MRRFVIFLAAGGMLFGSSGCLINEYSSDPNRRVKELLNQSEDLRQIQRRMGALLDARPPVAHELRPRRRRFGIRRVYRRLKRFPAATRRGATGLRTAALAAVRSRWLNDGVDCAAICPSLSSARSLAAAGSSAAYRRSASATCGRTSVGSPPSRKAWPANRAPSASAPSTPIASFNRARICRPATTPPARQASPPNPPAGGP